jgi:hypothetical protein
MSASSLPIATQLPADYSIDDPVTSSPFVLRRNIVEFLPHEQIEFQPLSGQDTIRININDQSSFWDAEKSYMRFQFIAGNSSFAAPADLANVPTISTVTKPLAPVIPNVRLGSAGLDGLFRMIEMRAVASGTVLMRQNFYNLGTAQSAYYFRGDEYSIGDGFDMRREYKQPRVAETRIHIPESTLANSGDVFVHTVTADTWSSHVFVPGLVTLAFTQTNLVGLVNVGDIIEFSQVPSAGTATSVKRYFKIRVTGIAPLATGLTSYVFGAPLSALPVAKATVSDADSKCYDVMILQRKVQQSQASYWCDGNYHTVDWYPANAVFWIKWPVFLMKGGVELIFYLENPNIALVQDVEPAAAQTNLYYKIKTPRLMGMMSTPEPSILQDFVGRWNSSQGIVYYCPQLETRKMIGQSNDGTMVINVPFGKRSIRYACFSVSPSDIINGNGAFGIVGDAFRCFLRSHISTLWIQVAANYFPVRRIEIDDEGNEVLWQSKNTTLMPYDKNGIMDMEKYQHKRYRNADCYYWTTTTVGSAAASMHYTDQAITANKLFECRDRVYCVNFGRVDGKGGILSGIDGSVSSVDFMVERKASYNTNYSANEYRTGECDGLGDDGQVGVFKDQPCYLLSAYYDRFIQLSADSIKVME